MFLLLAFNSCRKRKTDCPSTSQYQQITQAAKEWFPYTGNRTIIFENGAQRDTMDLRNYFLGDGEVWVGDECAMAKGQFLRGNIIDRKAKDTLAVEIGYGDRILIKKKAAYILYYDFKSVLILPSNYRRFETSVSFGSKTFTNVLVFECAPADNCAPAGITKFYFSRGKGLVAYQRGSVTWTLR
jgi:hypothetical protein